ncbi:MAG: cob(I)yrinic acid a,c-diamide adenosyltransferase [Deltaproteobacteria bacterium]|nr:cob(I)yrinic acid a,c-diamide adenosyltransferase [Deltaproteobacteria bacterium]
MEYYAKNEMPWQKQGLGMIHVCFGTGVGKTSRAVGLAIRAAGAGLNVHFIQFMKSGDSAEAAILRQLPQVQYYCPGPFPFVLEKGPEPVHFQHVESTMARVEAALKTDQQVLICDEILNALLFKILRLEQVLELIDRCRGRVELVLTGSAAPPEIVAVADYVTEFVQIKHPYYSGASARHGVEF